MLNTCNNCLQGPAKLLGKRKQQEDQLPESQPRRGRDMECERSPAGSEGQHRFTQPPLHQRGGRGGSGSGLHSTPTNHSALPGPRVSLWGTYCWIVVGCWLMHSVRSILFNQAWCSVGAVLTIYSLLTFQSSKRSERVFKWCFSLKREGAEEVSGACLFVSWTVHVTGTQTGSEMALNRVDFCCSCTHTHLLHSSDCSSDTGTHLKSGLRSCVSGNMCIHIGCFCHSQDTKATSFVNMEFWGQRIFLTLSFPTYLTGRWRQHGQLR